MSQVQKLIELMNECQVRVFPCKKTSRAGKKYNSVGVIATDPKTDKPFWLNERYDEWEKGNKARPNKKGKKASKARDEEDEDEDDDEDDEDEE